LPPGSSTWRAVPAAGSTEALAWTFTVITAGMSAGSACGGVIIQIASTQVAFLAAGGSAWRAPCSACSGSPSAVPGNQCITRGGWDRVDC
jgi:hypothetical protein